MASVAATIPAFQQLKSIKAHSDNVNTLVFSDDGKFLASGGDDGYIHIFTTKDWQEFRKYKAVSPVRVMIWHPGSSNVIAAGLKNGIVNTIQVKNNVKWEHSVKGTVHCMSFRGHDKLLAVGFNNQVLVAKQTLLSAWSNETYIAKAPDVQGEEDVTRSVHFHTKEKLLLVIYLFNGIIAYDTEDLGTQRWCIDVQGLCGDSALSTTSRLLVTTNLADGINWYDTSNKRMSSKTVYPVVVGSNVPLPVIFIGTNVITAGSARGEVSIFKSGNPQALQVLSHNNEMVQALAHYYDVHQKTHILITGISEQYEECLLTIWIAKDKRKTLARKPWNTMFYALFGSMAGLGGLIATKSGPALTAVYNDHVVASGQHLADKVSQFWATYRPGFRSSQDMITVQAEIHTQIITKTVEIFVTSTSIIDAAPTTAKSSDIGNMLQDAVDPSKRRVSSDL